MTKMFRKVEVVYGVATRFQDAITELNRAIEDILAIDEHACAMGDVVEVDNPGEYIFRQQWAYMQEASAEGT